MSLFGFLGKKLIFSEATSLVKIGSKRILEAEDALPLPRDLDPRHMGVDQSSVDWTDGRRLVWTSIRAARRKFTWSLIAYLLSTLCGLVAPVLINHFIKTLSGDLHDDAVLAPALAFGLGLGFFSMMRGLLLQHYFYHSLRAYQVVVNLINEKLFRHSLMMTQAARMKIPVGDVVNHMSSDAETVADFRQVFADILWTVVILVGAMSMLFYYIGLSAIVPLVIMFAVAPLTKQVAKRFSHLDDVMMKERDGRVTLMTQILNAIRVVKFFGWEKSVEKEVFEIRDREIGARRKMARAELFSSVAYVSVSSLVLFTALAVHAYRGFDLDAALVFTCVSLFSLLEEPFGNLSRLISRTTNAFVSARRIVSFLRSETLPSRPDSRREGHDLDHSRSEPETSVALEAQGLEAFGGWTLSMKAGESLALVGPVGGGKSTLLQVLLGETLQDRARVRWLDGRNREVLPRMAYVPQEAYIINGPLEENLRFGRTDASEAELARAVHFASFEADLLELPAGYRTEIGEKGVNLSGGQKQRVGLARAWLQNPQVVFLDDPLSAVDVETEKTLCDRLLFGEWKNRTRIVATHRLENLESFDRIAFLEGGRVRAEGTFEGLAKDFAPFRAFLKEHRRTQGETRTLAAAVAEVSVKAAPANESRITEDEEREIGAVKGSVYWDYFRSLGGEGRFRNLNLFLLFFGAVSVMSVPMLQRWWLSQTTRFHEDPKMFLAVYGTMAFSAILISLMNGMWWLERGIRAGQLLHDRMLKSILRATLRFFDSTPVGRIVQRFSRDVESVDIYLQWSFDATIHCMVEIALSLALIALVVPQVLIVMAPVLLVYYAIQRDYRRPAREIKRLDSIARSPRYAHFKETLMGLPVIRGFHREKWFIHQFHEKLAYSQRMFYSHYLLNRWFSVRVPLIGGAISVGTALAVLYSAREGMISPGTAGLLMVYSLSFWGYLNWGIRMFADIESRMTSVERLRTYSTLPGEKQTVREPANPLPDGWPSNGDLVLENVEARYASHLPLVLKGVSFRVRAGERVGIIGRTGSGKSTLFQTLFRFVELESGRIVFGGEDIATVPLERLRRSLAIIPQDPTLFLGTVRSNLDRFGEYTDEDVYAALEKASLAEFIRALPGGLQAAVVENGLNFSQGQRQLMCLARALLCEVKLIVLDEATASVDVQTDAILQKVIRDGLKGVTLLIIAHRLGTVTDCDKIIELGGGRVLAELRPREALDKLREIEAAEAAASEAAASEATAGSADPRPRS